MTALAPPTTLAVSPVSSGAFDRPDPLAAKADPALITADERHFTAIAKSL